ncbi:FecR family protein [Chitinophaga sp. sic0106]|uniref:FecR family protein n=1 Tax=Chitinophaga sp. sic0106 TaxID=2854785 RepID=UPI001C46A1E7|nr:FecR domain-containing protein [Chitinophaga sp. sic0106]MBV7533873.1 FecR domain-containing protein [Chitinophaga sp. sic0106]
MYQPNTDATDLIVRFINAPHDPHLQDQIAALKNQGPEQAAYVEKLLQDWLQDDMQRTVTTRPTKKIIPICKWCAVVVILLLMVACYLHFWSRSSLIVNTNQTGYIDSFLLADGSKAILNSSASIAYPKSFDKELRQVYMQKGEAFFAIRVKNDQPFELIVGDAVHLKLEAAAFNVRMDQHKIAVYVTDGKLKMKGAGEDELLLTPGLQGIYSKKGLEQEIMMSDGALAWKTGRLRFVNVPLKEVLQVIRNYYDIQVDVPPSAHTILKKKVTANFESEGPEKVLEVVSKKIGVYLSKDKEGRYYLTLK